MDLRRLLPMIFAAFRTAHYKETIFTIHAGEKGSVTYQNLLGWGSFYDIDFHFTNVSEIGESEVYMPYTLLWYGTPFYAKPLKYSSPFLYPTCVREGQTELTLREAGYVDHGDTYVPLFHGQEGRRQKALRLFLPR